MTTDKDLLDIYLLGFNDELSTLPEVDHHDELKNKAYNLGRLHAIVGDDVSSIDLQSNEYILRQIKGMPRRHWVCNECNFPNYNESISAYAIENELLYCFHCGSFEFHLEEVKNKQ